MSHQALTMPAPLKNALEDIGHTGTSASSTSASLANDVVDDDRKKKKVVPAPNNPFERGSDDDDDDGVDVDDRTLRSGRYSRDQGSML